ncbi:MAG TPA: oligosaccharide flippase family protein [Bacteroidales bacterium]|nr:oligosaccharide flippase family protein [Bacteroidales bacterium]
MGVIFKQSFKGTVWSYIGTLLGFVITGLMLPNFFSTDEVGLFRVLVSYGTIFAQLANLGVSSVTVKLFPFFRDKDKKHHGFLGFTLLIGLAGTIISVILFLAFKPVVVADAQEKSALFVTYIYYVLPLILFTLLYNVFDTYYRVLYNAVIGTFYKEVVQRIFILIVIILFYFGYIDFNETVIFYVLANILPSVILFFSIIRDKVFFIIPSRSLFSKKFLSEFFTVAFFGLINSFSGVLALNIDVIMINALIGLSAAGIYSITFFFGALILVPSRSVTKISSVVAADAWKKNDLKMIYNIYQKSSLTLTLIGLWILAGIWGNVDNIFHLIKPEYLEGKYVILVIGIANVIDLMNGNGRQIIFNSKYYKNFSAYLTIYVILLVTSNYIFIPIFGIIGAAMATLLSKVVLNAMVTIHMFVKHRLFIFNYKYPLIFLMAFAAYFLSTLMPALPNYIVDIFIRSTLISVLYLVPILAMKISPDINENLIKILKYIGISVGRKNG